jgi:hypothetical protein
VTAGCVYLPYFFHDLPWSAAPGDEGSKRKILAEMPRQKPAAPGTPVALARGVKVIFGVWLVLALLLLGLGRLTVAGEPEPRPKRLTAAR